MSSNKHINLFIPATEYHILLTLSVIEEKYSGAEYDNVLMIGGRRLRAVNPEAFPANVRVVNINFEGDKDVKKKVEDQILSLPIKDIFVFHSFRYQETYILSRMKKGVGRHLLQDGTVFYTRINKVMFFGLVKQTFKIYRELLNRGILLKKLVFYKRYLQEHALIDDVWITNPDIYKQPEGVNKPLININLFPKADSIERFNKYFLPNEEAPLVMREKYLMFLPPHFQTDEQMKKCSEVIRQLMDKLKPAGLLIKIHPNSSEKQVNYLTKEFGDVVVKNNVPAELYFANAKDCVIVATASTSLLYHNPSCRYYALIGFFQSIGLYPEWKHVTLPSYVQQIKTQEEFNNIH